MFDLSNVEISSEYSGSWGKTPPAHDVLSSEDTLKAVNDAIKVVMGDDFEMASPVAARLVIHSQRGSPPESIMWIKYSATNIEAKSPNDLVNAEETLLDTLVGVAADIEEGEICSYPWIEHVEEPETTWSGIRFFQQIHVDEVPLEDGRFIISVVSTENYKVTAAIVNTITTIIKDWVKEK